MKKNVTKKAPFSKAKYLGDFVLNPFRFENLDKIFEKFQSAEFETLNSNQKSQEVSQELLSLIQNAPPCTFLLIAVLEFIDELTRKKLLPHYSFSSFELWLNQFSTLSTEENYLVRGKIVGKWVPRDEYQIYFPIGMGKTYPGSHFVTAHSSPDLDTTIASFWGWVDAFGARVSEGLHVWNVPGGPPPSSIEVALLFYHIFGQTVFSHLSKNRSSLALSSLDLMSQQGMVKQKTHESSVMIDHERSQKAFVLVDEKGYFLGDWRSFDVEGVRQVVLHLNNCLRFFENNLHVKLISLFTKVHVTLKNLPPFIQSVFGIKIKDSMPAQDLSEKQLRHLEGYLHKVLKIQSGLEATFAEFALGMKALGLKDFQECINKIEHLSSSELFNAKGVLIEDRPKIFNELENIIRLLDLAIQNVRTYTERLDVALHIKTHVFGYMPQVVSYRANVEEVRSKMGNYPYLTVTSAEEEGKMVPLGIVRSGDIHQAILGTVTLRDFCNREETKIPSYFEVISVIDHHKTSLQTAGAPVVYISDAQSSNSVLAELSLTINDKYSTGGMSLKDIEEQLSALGNALKTPTDKRLFQRLLTRHAAACKHPKHAEDYFVDPLREFIEYLHFLYAILDDTDLLTKVSCKDVECVAKLLNRLKSLLEGKEVEILHFDDLVRDATFVEKAATQILKHPDMYSLYRKIYLAKECLVEENLESCAQGNPSSFFVDVKLQNGCCRVGQSKMFSNNFASFEKYAVKIRILWLMEAMQFYEDRREFDLHLHMISTIAGAEDLFSGTHKHFAHKDELWIWIPMTEQSIQRLKGFLNAFRNSSQIAEHAKQLSIEFYGPFAKELSAIFQESFRPTHKHVSEALDGPSLAVIRFPAGLINSRKAMISPYLPKVLS